MSNELEQFKQDLLKSVKQMRQGEAARCFGADIAGLGAGAARADRSRQDLVEGRIRTPGSAFETRAPLALVCLPAHPIRTCLKARFWPLALLDLRNAKYRLLQSRHC